MSAAASLTIPGVLDGAADVLAARGWHQGSYRPDAAYSTPGGLARGPVCVLAAISIAAGEDPAGGPTVVTLPVMVVLAEHLGYVDELGRLENSLLSQADIAEAVVRLLGDWNDMVARSVAHVIRVLRAAAANERKAGR